MLEATEARRMPLDEIFSFFKDVTSGLHHLHANGYVHRDLKPSNCLLHTDSQRTSVLVSDFGEVQAATATRASTGATGTISYCAPEVLKRDSPAHSFGNFTTKSDIFSLGLILYFMCFGRLPYIHAVADEADEDVDRLRAEIAAWPGFDDAVKIREDLPERLYKFLKRLLSIDPDQRPSTEEILQGIKTGTGTGTGVDEARSPVMASFPYQTPALRDNLHPRFSSVSSPAPTPMRRDSSKRGRPGPLRSGLRHNSDDKHKHSQGSPGGGIGAGARSVETGVVLSGNRTLSSPPSTPIGQRTTQTPPQQPSSPPPLPRYPPLMLAPPPVSDPSSAPGTKDNTSRALTTTPKQQPISPAHTSVSSMTRTTIKISLFLLKLATLLCPCAPFAAEPRIMYALLTLAALDTTGLVEALPMHGTSGELWPWWFSSILLGLAHVVAVLSLWQSGRLCDGVGPVGSRQGTRSAVAKDVG